MGSTLGLPQCHELASNDAMRHTPKSGHIPIDQLRFDPENPRFFSEAEDLNEIAVINRMLDQEDALKLVLSIGEKGYYEGEPLLVVPEAENRTYIVVEGNRRLAALKILTNQSIRNQLGRKTIFQAFDEATHENIPAEIPCLIFDHRSETLEYLGFRHITGAKPWGPLAKAKFLRQLEATIPKGLSPTEKAKSLAKTIGSNPQTVRDLLVAYNVYEIIERNNFFDIDQLNRETLEFGVFYTALKSGAIKKHVAAPSEPDDVAKSINIPHLAELTRWIYEKKEDPSTGKLLTRLGESRNITRLSRIVSNSQALKAFRSGVSLKAAVDMTGEQLELFEKACSHALDQLKQAAGLVNESRDRLTQQHTRITSSIQIEADELHERVRKQSRINENA